MTAHALSIGLEGSRLSPSSSFSCSGDRSNHSNKSRSCQKLHQIQNMATDRGCMFLKDVTPATPRVWAVQVRVLEKSFPRTSESGSSNYQRLILIDKQGTRVQATIFGDEISFFANTLAVLHKYRISNANVQPIQAKHRIVPNDYQWIFTRRTPVTELQLNEADDIAIHYNLIRFSDLHTYMKTSDQIDIIAVVVDALPQKTVTARNESDLSKASSDIQELVVINEELRPMTLTTWKQFVPNETACIVQQLERQPIIIATRVTVESFNAQLSLSTKQSTLFVINPDVPEAAALRTWVSNNQQAISLILAEKSYLSKTDTTGPSSTTHWRSPAVIAIKDIPANPDQGDSFRVQGQASIASLKQNFVFMCCDQCESSIDADYGDVYFCQKCETPVTAVPKCCIEIELKDPSGTITATIFGSHAEKLFSTTAVDFYKSKQKDGTLDTQRLHLPSTVTEYIFRLRASHRTYANKQTIRFYINQVLETTNDASTSQT